MSSQDLPTPTRGTFVERAAKKAGALPPQHISDLTPEERKAAVIALGVPGFRADQLSRQWFGRLNDDPRVRPAPRFRKPCFRHCWIQSAP